MKTFKTATITDLVRNPAEYFDLVEAGEIIYIIRNSIIVAKLERIDFRGRINEVSKKRGIVI